MDFMSVRAFIALSFTLFSHLFLRIGKYSKNKKEKKVKK